MPSSQKDDDRITFRADPDQLLKLRELEKQSKDLKISKVVRAALRHYFACEESRLPNGDLLNPPVKAPARRPRDLPLTPQPEAAGRAAKQRKSA
jgi:hypothetical protein